VFRSLVEGASSAAGKLSRIWFGYARPQLSCKRIGASQLLVLLTGAAAKTVPAGAAYAQSGALAGVQSDQTSALAPRAAELAIVHDILCGGIVLNNTLHLWVLPGKRRVGIL